MVLAVLGEALGHTLEREYKPECLGKGGRLSLGPLRHPVPAATLSLFLVPILGGRHELLWGPGT